MNKRNHKEVQQEQSIFRLDTLKNRVGYSLFLLILSFILYGNTIRNEYAIDDPIVTNNEVTRQGISAIPHIFTSRYRVIDDYNYGYRPIAKSTYAIEYQLFGQNPHISHFINVLIYALIGIFLFFLLSKFLKEYHTLFPLIITVLFMAHPIHTEVVASLKNREELLSFLGCIISLYFFIRYAETRKGLNILFGLFFYVFAFLSKQNAITFAAVIPLSIYFFTDTSFHFKFIQMVVEIFARMIQRIRAFFIHKYTILFIGLFFYYATNIAWYYGLYLYTTLLLLPTILLLVKFYLITHPSKKPIVSSLLKNRFLWIGLILYAVAMVARYSDEVDMLLVHVSILIFAALGAIPFLRHFTKHFALKQAEGSFVMKNAYGFIAIFYYGFPFFDELILLNVIAGLLPLLIYFLPNAGLMASELKPISIQSKIGWRDLVGSISASTRLFFLLAIVLGAVSYGIVVSPDEFLPPEQRELYYFENPLFYNTDLGIELGTSMYALLIYVKLLVLPHPLVFYYGFNHIPIVGLSNGWVILSVFLHSFLFVYALLKFREKHLLSFAILYYLFTVFIFSNIALKIPGIVGERLLFMPSLGFCIALAFMAFKILKIDPKVEVLSKNLVIKLLLVTSLLVIPYSIKTIARNVDWKNHSTLYLHDIPYLENSLHANALVASQMLRDIEPNPQSQAENDQNRERLELVVKHFEQVLVIDPNEVKTLNNLGRVHFEFYQAYGQAVNYFEQAIKLEPATAEAMFNIAQCYEQLNRLEEAKNAFLTSINIDSVYVKSISGMANLYFKMDMRDSALFLNDRLAVIDPDLDLPYINVGNYFLQTNKEAQAVEMFEKAVKLNPKNVQLVKALADYFREQGDQNKVKYYTDIFSSGG